MTLVISIVARESICMMTDRRLTYANNSYKDDACKVMSLETPDGAAILGYAGLGKTARGTEPSTWMSNVLRGVNLPLELCLGKLMDAVVEQIPKHAVTLPKNLLSGHHILIPAFVDGKAQLYSIEVVPQSRHLMKHRFTRHVWEKSGLPVRIGIAGSGSYALSKKPGWERSLLSLIDAHDNQKISPLIVADRLAKLNHEVHICEKSVGKKCVVLWKFRREGPFKSGSRSQCYVNGTREPSSITVPTIGSGYDINALGKSFLSFVFEAMRAKKLGASEAEIASIFDKGKIDHELKKLPDSPDTDLY